MSRTPSLPWAIAIAMGIGGTLVTHPIIAQERKPNYDESLVDIGVLPDPLLKQNGALATKDDWQSHRKELVRIVGENQFGHIPDLPFKLDSQVTEQGLMHDGQTLRRQIEVTVSTDAASHSFDVAFFTPTNQTLRGVFVGLNFRGNHTADESPELRLPKSWVPNEESTGAVDNKASEVGRGKQKLTWPIQEITSRGYGVATVYCGDIDPDFHDGFDNGVHRLFPELKPDDAHPNRWGTISAWAWGLSRIVDTLETLPDVKNSNYAVIGHSRLGKASLWAGANDERFKLVVSNNSGCGGAALERRNIGETVAIINRVFPHWFCGNFRKYNDNEQAMPHDAHFIIASVAPRPVYIASATEDSWADPKGEYLSGFYANPAYELFGLKGLPGAEPPAADTSVGEHVGYHNRTGKHAILPYDWQRYMDFADKNWSK